MHGKETCMRKAKSRQHNTHGKTMKGMMEFLRTESTLTKALDHKSKWLC
jgi:hypothetical protein